MSFFTHQQNARNNTTRFVILFIIGTIILPILTALAIEYFEKGHFPQSWDAYPWDITYILLGGTLGIIIPVALFKFHQFKVGGYIIAEQLGGRYIDPQQPTNFQERQLINIVIEMAIAANIPPPHVYILDQEASINAFAAGYTLNDVAIGITKGALDVLTREELMALVGHELSHILNEDMRINLRFTAIICGMYALMTIGYYVLISFGGNSRHNSSSKKDSSPAIAMIFAFIFMIIGWILALWGNIMQASISRQREFLADASSAQFTRMPHAVASLLKKIGGSVEGSIIHTANSKAYSHMFFSSSASQIFSTHPPLKDRILHMEPEWDGNYIQPVPLYDGYNNQNYFPTNQFQTPYYADNNSLNNTTNDPFI
ncbi:MULTISPECIES: M48 family metalloprotease [Commensalibacter]|uniref:Peptidase M48 Ste24p n=2 Tax=Commensalibacter TaxID=1079922 RepID=W7E5L7_9PROT|nr:MULTISPECIES: M48 family metalloprotease [Commensalibacter]EUK18376.1 peptidase M48 Ste24p [Commensalibacter papalotli (ex Servin-Garciduenas et al. 2014)]CAI3934752.1 Zn-dependent protease with chaperone function (HtpX) (PDB:2YPT) [Commensalibacter papalotli (ex Botero et al. 2024)]CAI3940952.1 Zn-dependent protease with chaperone function (HtpX) (PDB:2YPT) [Commensalibacter papalotli (ex Botero et al. 2024)]